MKEDESKRGKQEIPRDNWNLAYIFLFIHGVGFLLPWNVFINAREYFVDYKLNTTISRNSDYRINFVSYLGICAQLPNLIMAALNTFYQSKTSASNPSRRFKITMAIELMILLATIVLIFVNTSEVPLVFFVLTMVSVILINCCVGIHQTLIFGMAAYLPMQYSNAVVIGNNACGTLIAMVNIITKAVSLIWGRSERSMIISTTSYFCTAIEIVIVCVITFFALQRLPFVRFYLDQTEGEKEPLTSAEDPQLITGPTGDHVAEDKLTSEGDAVVSVATPMSETEIETGQNSSTLCCLPGGARKTHCAAYWGRYAEAFKDCWPQCLNVWLIFVCTLSIFPAVQSSIKAVDPNFFISDTWFTDITCFLFFNLFAMLGCVLSAFFTFPAPKFLCIPVVIRLIFFVPFFLLSNYVVEGERQMPLWISSDYAYLFGSIIFALTNGYFASLAMMYAPRNSPPGRSGLAGLITSFFLILGVFSGVYISRGLLALL